MSNKPALKFRTIINGQLQLASGTGVDHGLLYTVSKGGNNSWMATVTHADGKVYELALGVSFARAKKASNDHHRGIK